MSEWRDVGPGACDGETLRRKEVEGGYLLATVYQQKGYDAKGEVTTRGEVTRSLTFVPQQTSRVLTEG